MSSSFRSLKGTRVGMHRQNSHEQQQLNATNNNTEVGRGRIAVNNLSSPHQTTTTTTATSSELCPGTRRSTNTSSILTSTGIASLDGILGGGVPLQTVMMVREDRLTGYARLMLKYWICQGLASGGQHVFVAAAAAASSASAGVDGNGGAKKNEMTGKDAAPLAVNNNFSAADGHIPHHRELLPIVADLMDMCQGDEDGQEASGSALLDDEDAASSSSASSSLDDKMKIAWRYQNLRPHQSSTSSTSAGMLRTTHNSTLPNNNNTPASLQQPSIPYCNRFDITKKVDPRILLNAQAKGYLKMVSIESLVNEELLDHQNSSYDKLYNEIRQMIDLGGFSLSSPIPPGKPCRPVLRIAIHSLASPYWCQNDGQFFRFIHKLKHLVSSASACCVITVPAYLYNDYHLADSSTQHHSTIRSVERLVDCVIEVESFLGTPRKIHPAYLNSNPAYHGLIHAIKLFNNVTLLPPAYRTFDSSLLRSLVFRVRRKRFLIETFHLPPDDDALQEKQQQQPQQQQNAIDKQLQLDRVKEVADAYGKMSVRPSSSSSSKPTMAACQTGSSITSALDF